MGTFRTLSASDIDGILAAFGLGAHQAATPIAAGTVNTNYLVDLPDGRRFLRINEGKAEDDVRREAAIVNHLAGNGVTTPRPLLALDRQPFVRWNGTFVSIFPFVNGRTLSRQEVGPNEAQAAGEALARLHLAGADFADHRPGRYEADEIDRRLHAIVAIPGDPVLTSAVSILAPALAHLRVSRAQHQPPLGLIHGDLFIDNVLYDDSTLTALLDFEQASWGRLVYDLAVSVLAFGFGHDDFRADVTRAFIDGYAAVRPPTPVEDRAFGDELRFAACRFAVTRITDVYLRRADGAPRGKDFWRYIQRLHAVERHQAERSGLFRLT